MMEQNRTLNDRGREKIEGLVRSAKSAVICVVLLLATAASTENNPHAKIVELTSGGKSDTVLLSGPPETVSLRSGLVVLQPGESVGKHTTGGHEELLVILEGKGTMMFHDGTRLEADPSHILYCPPQTEHDVTNTGSGPLRYVYVVAVARP